MTIDDDDDREQIQEGDYHYYQTRHIDDEDIKIVPDDPDQHRKRLYPRAGGARPASKPLFGVWVYRHFKDEGCYTVGHYTSLGQWEPESDWPTAGEAARRVHWLNGGHS